ncbi:hypothetical protein HYY75_11565 [bacterium]|nr:hypothetical protein [bacterium]
MFSDGDPSDFDNCKYLLEHFRSEKIVVTTMAVGFYVNSEVLKTISDGTGGEFYSSLEFSELPNLFREEFKRISGPPYIEETFQPLLANNQTMARGLTASEVPSISGHVVTHLKDKATIIMSSQRGDPVMAYWRFGLGRGVAFTPDLLPKWTHNWAKWNGFGKLLRQTMKELSEGTKQEMSVSLVQKGIDLTLKIEPGLSNKFNLKKANISSPFWKTKTLALSHSSDGTFETQFSAPISGIYHAKIEDENNQMVCESPISVNNSQEFSQEKTNLRVLRRISEKTGGDFFESIQSIPEITIPPSQETPVFISFWQVLAIFGLLLYFVDIYLRKANTFGISNKSELKGDGGSSSDEIYRQLAQKFSNMAEEHSLKGEEGEAKRYYLRAKAFYIKAQAVKEANQMWDRYKRFEKI